MGATEPSTLSRAQRWAVALVATFTMSISYVDRQAFAVLAPVFRRELGISDAGYGLLASAFSLAYLVGAPLSGHWIDRVGARRALPRAVLGWTVVAALHALAPGFAALFALRVALGLAESPSFPGAAQTVHRVMPPAERPRALGVLFTGSSLGAMVAPPLALTLAAWFGWRLAFLGTAVVGAVWLPVWWAVTTREGVRAALDAQPEPAPEPPAAQVDPSVSGAAFREAALRAPDHRAAWRHPAVWRTVALVLASAPALGFVLLWFPTYLTRLFSVSAVDVRWLLVAPPLVFDVGAVAFGDVASRVALRRGRTGSAWGLVLVAAALTAVLAALPLAATPAQATLVAAVTMFGGGGVYALLTAEMLARVSPSRVSAAGGLAAAAQSLAYVIANPLIGMYAQRAGYHDVVVALGLWLIPGATLWLLWPKSSR